MPAHNIKYKSCAVHFAINGFASNFIQQRMKAM